MCFRAADAALLRTTADPTPELPRWPDLTGFGPEHAASLVDWLRVIWTAPSIAEAIDHASPALARQVHALCNADRPAAGDARRAVLSVCRYLQRMYGRATPFGLFAGVAAASFGALRMRWGSDHEAIAHASAEWVERVISDLEDCSLLLARLSVVANTTAFRRGDHLVVPHQPPTHEHGVSPVEVRIRHSEAVRVAIEAARTPIAVEDLAGKLRSEFPTDPAQACMGMLTGLVKCRALITSLHAPSTTVDPLGHLLRQLDAVDAASVPSAAARVSALRGVHALVGHHNQAPAAARRPARTKVIEAMRRVAETHRHPLALDLRIDADMRVPSEIAQEVERAAHLLTRLAVHPAGIPAWKDFHQRFYERYGIGTMVPLLDVVADSGIGWPDGYPGTASSGRRQNLTDRDRRLFALAQQAALDGCDEILLDDRLIDELAGPQFRPPPHLEVAVRVRAVTSEALRRGRFMVDVLAVSRAAGVLTGRFLDVLTGPGRDALAAALADLPGSDGHTFPAQLSFPPLDPATAHVTRAPQTLPRLISLAEHRRSGGRVLVPADLAVGCDGRRIYLAVPDRGVRLEAAASHTLNLHRHTPPLARFLTELARAQSAQVTAFHWGAADGLPFLPRLRYGRIILSPARWRLLSGEVPGTAAPWQDWDRAFTQWRDQRKVPRRAYLTEGDRLLPLDLDHEGHRVLLRTHVRGESPVVLTEAPDPAEAGWCDGRAHELIVPLVCTRPPQWPALPKPCPERLATRDLGQVPAASRVLLVSLYGDLHRQDDILTGYLPELLDVLQHPQWWFVRFRDPDQHLRLRVALPEPEAFGDVAGAISTWADRVHQEGLLRELRYPTSYRETGRWGSGAAMAAAERVFAADSRAVLAQLLQPTRPRRQALAAAHLVAIACAFTGGTAAGMRWLIDHLPPTPPTPVPRQVHRDAVRLANPAEGWAALRGAPGGSAIVDAWRDRDLQLAAYRQHFPGQGTRGVVADDVLFSLLHHNHVRGFRIDFADEDTVRALARAAAKAWTARQGRRVA